MRIMKLILLDTGFLFALKSEKDKRHIRANQILDLLLEKYNEPKLIPYLILNETITLAISRYNGNMDYVKNYYSLFWGDECFFKIIKIEQEAYQQIYKILEKYCNKKRKLSFTDASLIYLYKELHAKYIVSFDGHFDNIVNRVF
ncbi:MAG: PIN domain-containing protein [Candidatus Lokiarchaeota archaeon]|nr:PIN domain-containing protein [Candidatus Lokiarchaeota archaeon]MBD3199188.1 PIN domain-containing protein [Candidatus Lokiarchaeota archaeon]